MSATPPKPLHPLLAALGLFAGAAAIGGAVGALFDSPRPSRRARRAERRWQRDERETCDDLGEEHVGGPGRPDCMGIDTVTEVKSLSRPADSRHVQQAFDKAVEFGGRPVLVSHSGFTGPARVKADLLGVELVSRRRRR